MNRLKNKLAPVSLPHCLIFDNTLKCRAAWSNVCYKSACCHKDLPALRRRAWGCWMMRSLATICPLELTVSLNSLFPGADTPTLSNCSHADTDVNLVLTQASLQVLHLLMGKKPTTRPNATETHPQALCPAVCFGHHGYHRCLDHKFREVFSQAVYLGLHSQGTSKACRF